MCGSNFYESDVSFWTTIGNSDHSGVPNVAKLQRKDCSPYLYCLLIVQDLKTIFVLHIIYLSRPSVVRPSEVSYPKCALFSIWGFSVALSTDTFSMCLIIKSTQYQKLVPNALRFTNQNLKSCKPHEKFVGEKLKTNGLTFIVPFFHMICKISNSNM